MVKRINQFNSGNLKVSVYKNRAELGKASADYVADQIQKVSGEKEDVRIVFAAAVSQNEFLEELIKIESIPWNKIIAFQMDEYHTLPHSAPQRFGNFLIQHLFKHKNFKKIHLMDENIQKYEKLINESPIDIICLGIGENGHLAFNDPPVADFIDPEVIKEVELDGICRQQQVNDGAFDRIEKVPEKAVTLTIPTLMNANILSTVVAGASKAKAVSKTIFHPVSTEWPSTILRKHGNARLFLDKDATQLI